jgi:excinuclease ABC subunit B
MAEDLTDYLLDKGIRVRYLHSEVDTLRRVELLRELADGEFDVLVGINLLARGPRPARGVARGDPRRRQGGLPALDPLAHPDHRRAARNVSGQVHMYADKLTPSMQPTPSRRPTGAGRSRSPTTPSHGIDPQPLRKKIADITDLLAARTPTPRSCSAR